ncbi:MAG: aldolase [Terracidiphilus sp.]
MARIVVMDRESSPEVDLRSDHARRQSGPQSAPLSEMDLPLHRTYYPLGYSVEIITNETAVLEAAEESFGHIRFPREITPLQIRIGVSHGASTARLEEPARRQYNHLYSLVANRDNQALIDMRAGISFVWLTQSALSNRLYFRNNFLEKTVYLLLGASAVTDIHAACVSRNGRGILLCGDSGAGKSTLAYACARAGFAYTSDDTSYLVNNSDEPRVIGHCHRVRFRPTATEIFPELVGRRLSPRMEGKPSIEVPVCELSVPHPSEQADIHSIVFLARMEGAACRLIRLPDGTATYRLCRQLYSSGEIRAKHEKILKRFWSTPAYELQYSGLSEAIEALDSLTREL